MSRTASEPGAERAPEAGQSSPQFAAMLLHALDHVPHGILVFDQHKQVLFSNRRHREIYGLSDGEVAPGTPVADLIRRRAELGRRSDIDRYVEDCITGPIVPVDGLEAFADGRFIAYSVRPLPGGGGISVHQDVTQHERLTADLRERGRQFDLALGTMAGGLCMLDDQLRIVACNEQYRRLFRLPADVARPGASLFDLMKHSVAEGRHGGITAEQMFAERLTMFRAGQPSRVVVAVDERTIESTYRPIDGGGWVATYDDITERKQFERELAEQNRRFHAALNNMPHGLGMFDADGRLIVCNQRYAEMYRLPAELTRPGTKLEAITDYRLSCGQGPHDLQAYRTQQIERSRSRKPQSYNVTFTDGRVLRIDHRPMEGGGWVSIHQDVTEAARTEARITHLAHHDALTNLPNRVLFRERLEQALAGATGGEHVAVLCLDLDEFKGVNDTLGHPVGDELLKIVAARLQECVGDAGTVARLGGDEFAIIQNAGADLKRATSLARGIIDTLSTTYAIGDHVVNIATSIGIAVAPHDGGTADQLIKNADLALYRAKADGRGVHRRFEPSMDTRVRTRRTLELQMRQAMESDDFRLWYQPIVNLTTREVVAFEALLRWEHPERGLISPADFVPVAEETGLIVPLGAWVLKEACREAMAWPEHIKVSVNLSAVQFRNNAPAFDVAAALARSNLAPRRLEVEITETVMLHDTEATLETLRQIKALGVTIAMDDFGTGYSSLGFLRRFPFDKIKIDQTFVRGMCDDEESRAIVRAVTGLARSLGMTTTAEGVETADLLQALNAEGCTEAQGYYFSRPVPADRVADVLATIRRSLRAA